MFDHGKRIAELEAKAAAAVKIYDPTMQRTWGLGLGANRSIPLAEAVQLLVDYLNLQYVPKKETSTGPSLEPKPTPHTFFYDVAPAPKKKKKRA